MRHKRFGAALRKLLNIFWLPIEFFGSKGIREQERGRNAYDCVINDIIKQLNACFNFDLMILAFCNDSPSAFYCNQY